MLKRILTVSLFLLSSLTFAQTESESSNPKVLMKTNMGNIELELFAQESPITVANFLKYVDSGFYEGIIFHRVIAGFMIQGGGFNQQLEKQDSLGTIKNESGNGLSNRAGTISMARTNAPHSANSQFFINSVNNPNLDARGSRHGYAVFGRVTQGMDLVKRISRLPTQVRGHHRNLPKRAVVIEQVSRVTAGGTQSSAPAPHPAN